MSRIRIIKLFRFEMAHALWGYDGPCSNIHGHSYELEVCVSGMLVNLPGLPKNGMLIDFGDLKKVVNENIIDKYDHTLVIQKGTPYEEIFKRQDKFNKILAIEYQPTCENLVMNFVSLLKNKLPVNIKLESLKLRETSTSWAEWVSDDNTQEKQDQ